MASPAVVQSAKSTWTAASASSFGVTLTSTPTVGNTLLLIYGGTIGVVGNVVVAPAGYSTIVNPNQTMANNASGSGTNFVQLSAATRVVQPGDGKTWTFTLAGTGNSAYGVGAVIVEVSNAGVITSGATGDYAPGAVTGGDAGGLISLVANTNDLFFNAGVVFAAQAAGTSWSQASGTTAGLTSLQTIGATAGLFGSMAVYDLTVASGATITGGAQAAYVNSSNENWIGMAINIGSPPVVGIATPAILQRASSAWTVSTSTSFTCTLGATPTVGNVLVAIYGGLGSSTVNTNTVTKPTGFTQLQNTTQANSGPGNYLQLGFATRTVAPGDGTSYTFTLADHTNGGSTYGVGAVILEIAGGSASPTSAIASGASGALATLLTGGSASITAAVQDLVLCFGVGLVNTTGTAWQQFSSGATAGFTEVAQAGSTSAYFGSISVWQMTPQAGGTITGEPAAIAINNSNQQWITGMLDIPPENPPYGTVIQNQKNQSLQRAWTW